MRFSRVRIINIKSTLINNRVLRYLFSGGISASVDIILFKFLYEFIFNKSEIDFFGFVMESYSLSLVISYTCGSISSFILNKYFVFGIQAKGFNQLVKSLPVYFLAFLGNYLLLKLFIEFLHISPFFARILAALGIAFITFNIHRTFTFKSKTPSD